MTSELLELSISFLDQINSWILELLKLGSNKIDEHVDGGEAGKSITFVHLDSLLNMHIIVFVASSEALELVVKVVEAHFNFSSTLHLEFSAMANIHASVDVKASLDHVFVG